MRTESVELNDRNFLDFSYRRFTLESNVNNNYWTDIKLEENANYGFQYEDQVFTKNIQNLYNKCYLSNDLNSRNTRRENSCQTSTDIHLMVDKQNISNTFQRSLALELKNVWFKWNKEDFILRNVNINVKQCSIYCLLGSRGCGKTTLLKCIIGQLRPIEGSIKLFNNIECIFSRIFGYFPQDLALYNDLTVVENLNYFARVYGIKSQNIKSRIEFLIDFLDLPKSSKLISGLSASLKRCVSLAVAIVHKPPLLLLDEPFLCVNPILRQSIWNQLITLTQKENITIILTTHYAEEAKRADLIGFMDRNTILLESNPCDALKRFSAESLEDVLIKMNRFDDRNISSREEKFLNESVFNVNAENEDTSIYITAIQREPQSMLPMNNEIVNEKLFENKCLEVKRMYALICKNILQLKRNCILTVFLCLILPVIQVSLFCVCIGNQPKVIQISVFNPETLNSSNTDSLSFKMLKNIESTRLKLTYYTTPKEAIDSVKSGNSWAALVFSEYFTESLLDRIVAEPFYSLENETIEKSTIKLYADMTNFEIMQFLNKELSDSSQRFAFESLSRLPGSNPNAINALIQTQDSIYGDLNPSFRNFAVPGVISLIAFMTAVISTIVLFTDESKEKLLERSLIAGAKAYHIYLGYIAVQILVVLIQSILTLSTAYYFYDFPIEGSIGLVIGITLLQAICGMSFGLLISSNCDREQTAYTIVFGLLFSYVVMSGVLWPLESMPDGFRYLSYSTPHSLAVHAFRSIALRGWSLHYFQVWIGFVSSLVWIIIILLSALIAISYKK